MKFHEGQLQCSGTVRILDFVIQVPMWSVLPDRSMLDFRCLKARHSRRQLSLVQVLPLSPPFSLSKCMCAQPLYSRRKG